MHRLKKRPLISRKCFRLIFGESSLHTRQHSVNRFVNQKIYCAFHCCADTERPIAARISGQDLQRIPASNSLRIIWVWRQGVLKRSPRRKFSASFAAGFQGAHLLLHNELQLKLIWPLNNVKLVTWKRQTFVKLFFGLSQLNGGFKFLPSSDRANTCVLCKQGFVAHRSSSEGLSLSYLDLVLIMSGQFIE